MKKVLVIATGGTILMKPMGSVSLGLEHDLRSTFPKSDVNLLPRFDVLCWNPLIDSSDITLEKWNKLVLEILQKKEEYEGFLVLHGTDTLAYTAAYLSYAFGTNFGKTVLLTGAVFPIFTLESDGYINFRAGLFLAANVQIPYIGVVFNNHLIFGMRITKADTKSNDCFLSPGVDKIKLPLHWDANDFDIVRNNIQNFMKQLRSSSFESTLETKKVVNWDIYERILNGISLEHCGRVFTHHLCPGDSFEFLHLWLSSLKGTIGNTDIRGVIIFRSYGTGTLPLRVESVVIKAKNLKVPVIISTQCISGGCDLMLYENSNILRKFDVIDGFTRTFETVYSKVLHLLAAGINFDEFKSQMEAQTFFDIFENKPESITLSSVTLNAAGA